MTPLTDPPPSRAGDGAGSDPDPPNAFSERVWRARRRRLNLEVGNVFDLCMLFTNFSTILNCEYGCT